MFVITINDRVGTAAGFAGVRAFVGCADQAELIVLRAKVFGWSCSTEEVPLDKLPERSEAEKETVAVIMEVLHTD